MGKGPTYALIVTTAATLLGGVAGLPADAAAKPHARNAVRVQIKHGKLLVSGTAKRDVYTLRLKRKNRRVLQIDVGNNGSADREVPRTRFKSIAINAGRGNDVVRIDERNGTFERSGKTTITLGDGNDSFTGGRAAERISGGKGRDSVDGNGGNDKVALGAGDDAFRWDPGDGSDKVDGQAGRDRLTLNGSRAADRWSLTARGRRFGAAHAGDNARVNAGGFESLAADSGGGADVIIADSLAGTGLSRVAFDLGAGDNAPDALVVGGTGGDDKVTVGSGGVTGLAAAIAILGAGSGDSLTLNLLGGDDAADGSRLPAGPLALTMNGGDGDDTLVGGNGDDTLDGGVGNDSVDGNPGNDLIALGDGDDRFAWNSGDGADTVEGGGGSDQLTATGSDAPDTFTLTADRDRARVSRDANVLLVNAHDVEGVTLAGAGGADNLTVGDLSGSAVVRSTLDFGAADLQPDVGSVIGSMGNDSVTVTGNGVSGAGPPVAVAGAEAGLDRVAVYLLNGDDKADTSAVPAGTFAVTMNGGAGNDTFVGGPGDDTADGGTGTDTATLGDGNDSYIWSPGDGADTFEGQGGSDTVVVEGGDGADSASLAANGARLALTSTPDGGGVDNGGVENVAFNGHGGADSLTVGDLTGTPVTQTTADLGAGDGQPDSVVANATAGNDSVKITDAGVTSGLPTAIRIADAEATDRLTVNGLGGTDTLDASGVPAGSFTVALNGGDLSDTLIGGQGNDQLAGGRGDDLALMGAGDDVFSWVPGDGSDTVEGQAGTDRLSFSGANVSEHIDISANGSRVRFSRDVAAITMDLNDIEGIDVSALGGADTVTVNDLTGTDVTNVNVNLAATVGGGDASADQVVVNGRDGPVDAPSLTGGGGNVEIDGIAPTIFISGAEPANDVLTVNLFGGNDVVNAQTLAATSIHLIENGGDGNDLMIGSKGGDEMNGENGDDSMAGDDGDDFMTGGAGDDFIAGQGGNDTLDGGTGTNTVIQ
jgi:Ca2+-binding RTX toxin-like protein